MLPSVGMYLVSTLVTAVTSVLGFPRIPYPSVPKPRLPLVTDLGLVTRSGPGSIERAWIISQVPCPGQGQGPGPGPGRRGYD